MTISYTIHHYTTICSKQLRLAYCLSNFAYQWCTKKVVFDFFIHRSIYLQVFSKKSRQSCNSTQRCIWDHVKDLCVWDHCVKGVFIRNFSGPYFPVFGLNTEICKVYLFLRTNFGVLWLNFLKWNSWNYTLVYKEPCQKSEYLSLPREQHISAG